MVQPATALHPTSHRLPSPLPPSPFTLHPSSFILHPSSPPAVPTGLPSTDAASARQALTVTQLTAQIKDRLEGGFPSVWVAGEISNFARPQSGHCYFSLKDDRAQIRAVIWRGKASQLDFQPADGLEIVCRGHLDVYAPRGSYQLVVEEAIPKGVGALRVGFAKVARETGCRRAL